MLSVDLWPSRSHFFIALTHLLTEAKYNTDEFKDLREITNQFKSIFEMKGAQGSEISLEIWLDFLKRKLHAYLLVAKNEGYFVFETTLEKMRERIECKDRVSRDLELKAIAENPLYEFSLNDMSNINARQYELIKSNPILALFLLVGFVVNDDNPYIDRTIERTKELDCSAVIRLAESTKKSLGKENFHRVLLCFYENRAFDVNNLPALLNAANTIGNKAPEAFGRFLSELSTASSWEDLAKELPDLYALAMQESYVPIPHEEVFASYRKPSTDIAERFMVTEEELAPAIEHFKQVDALSRQFVGRDEAYLCEQLHMAVGFYKTRTSPEDKREHSIVIWAILRELFRQTYSLQLYSTQMINAYLILNAEHHKMTAQIKTGEGKSALQAIMMAYNALITGKKHFNVTTTAHLAERDAAKFRPYFTKVGFKCTSIVSTDPRKSHLYTEPSAYDGDIVYGTPDAFQFGYMTAIAADSDDPLRALTNPFDKVAVIDEVDSLLVDQQKNMARITSGNPFSPYDESSIWLDMWTYINKHQADHSLRDFRKKLIKKGYYTVENMQHDNILFLTYHWYHSAQAALFKIRERDYVIENNSKGIPSVIIVDKDTGARHHGSFWDSGLHQIIAAREKVRVPRASALIATITQGSYFNLFSGLFAVSGTTGGLACENYLKSMYSGMQIRNMPRYRASQALQGQHIISTGTRNHHNQLIADIRVAQSKGQPVLLLFATIRELKHFQMSASEHGLEVASLTGAPSEGSIENTLAMAGLPGSILAATFLAGRGADITTTTEAEENGGVMVLVCSPPENTRVTWQNFGRVGRQGRQGKFAFRFNEVDLVAAVSQKENNCKEAANYLGEESKDLSFPYQEWAYADLESESESESNSAPDSDSDNDVETTDKALETAYTAGRERHAVQVKQHLTSGQLFQMWSQLCDDAESAGCQMELFRWKYYHLIYELQRFIYQAKGDFPNLLTNRYAMLQHIADISARSKKWLFFQKYIGEVLIKMGEEQSYSADELMVLVRRTENPAIAGCLELNKTTAELMVPRRSSGPHWFFSNDESGTSCPKETSPAAGAGAGAGAGATYTPRD